MLIGLNPLLSPDLLHALAAMGHGDEIVVVDANFPAASCARRLIALDGIGAETAAALSAFFSEPNNQQELKALQTAVAIEPYTRKGDAAHPLFGKTIVFTGTLETMSRNAAKAAAEAVGAVVASGISKKVDFVVCGADAGSKRAKAEALNLIILDEAAFSGFLKPN